MVRTSGNLRIIFSLYNETVQQTRVDLHTHTKYSDGRLSPEELIKKAVDSGLQGVAVTDHDTVDAWDEAYAAGEKHGIEVISGVEMTVYIDNHSIHLLAYLFDPKNERLQEFLEEDRKRRRRRAEAMVAKLHALGIPLPFENVLEQAGGGSICRPHIARALLEEGYIDSFSEAFIRYIGDDEAAYVSVLGVGPEEAIEVIHRAGGVTAVAHPGPFVTDDMLYQLIEAGMDGIEVVHPSHDQLVTERYRKIAREKKLFTTGGSDYHGYRDVEEQRIGYYAVSNQQMKVIRAAAERRKVETTE